MNGHILLFPQLLLVITLGTLNKTYISVCRDSTIDIHHHVTVHNMCFAVYLEPSAELYVSSKVIYGSFKVAKLEASNNMKNCYCNILHFINDIYRI